MNAIEIRALIARDELWRFYKSKDWLRLKEKILKENHHECAECKKRGIITRYDIGRDGEKRLLSTVHHVMHVRDHPELAMHLSMSSQCLSRPSLYPFHRCVFYHVLCHFSAVCSYYSNLGFLTFYALFAIIEF